MSRIGENIKTWLGTTEKDQNLKQITDIENPILTTLRKWFHRRDISNSIDLGYYDEDTGQIVLGGGVYRRYSHRANYGTRIVGVDATAAAAHTITPATDIMIHFLTSSSANAAPKYTITYNDGANVCDLREQSGNDTQTIQNPLIGTTRNGVSNVAVPNPVFVSAGHSLVITDANWAAGARRTEYVYSVVN